MRLSGKLILFIIFLGLWNGIVFAQELGADERIIGWSPDGTQLAITSNRTGNQELYIIDTSGAIVKHLLEGQTISSAGWSADGQLAAIVGEYSETSKALYLVNPVTGESSLLATLPASYGFQVLWSPDGLRIALADDKTIVIVNVIDGQMETFGEEFYYPRVAWSPNGQFLAMVAKEYPEAQSEGVFFYDVVAQTRSANLLSTYWKRETPCCLTSVAWSPDSTQLAIAVMLDANIYISTIAEENLVPVAHTGGGIVSLVWANDGSGFYYHLDWRTDEYVPQEQLEGGRSGGIYRADIADGSITPLLLSLGQVFSVDFAPNSPLFSARSMDLGISRELLFLGDRTDGSGKYLAMDFFKTMGLSWSPDGAMIAGGLCETSEGDVDIYLINPVTGEAVNISQDDAFTGEPQPSNCPGMG